MPFKLLVCCLFWDNFRLRVEARNAKGPFNNRSVVLGECNGRVMNPYLTSIGG
jgi:hypothetical protein